MAVVRWLPEALDDLKRLYELIEPHSPQAADQAVNTLIDAAESLAEFPEKRKALGFRARLPGAAGTVRRARVCNQVPNF